MPEKSVVINIDRYGNTTAATIPLAMRSALDEGRLKKGDLVLLASELLSALLLLRFERFDAGLERCVGLLALQSIHGRLNGVALGLEGSGKRRLARLESVGLTLKGGKRGLAGRALRRDLLEVDDGDDRAGNGLSARDARSENCRGENSGQSNLFH